MNNVLKGILLAALLSLAGCAGLEQATKDVQKVATPTPATIEESLPQICRAAKDNSVRANETYVNKRLSTSGEILSISEGYSPRYRVLMKAGDINIHAGTETQNGVKQLSAGTTTEVLGTITAVTVDFYGCSIALEDATF